MPNKLAVAGPDSKFKQPDAKPAGFWAGYWHGMISPITFVVSLFKPGVRIYETNNNGRWYDLGFLMGASATFSGGIRANVGKPHPDASPAGQDEADQED
jgi:hypothetical protein